jgi:hypothetical protein
MKVKHLIEELMKCDQELDVITEGCDCDGDSYAVKESDRNTIYWHFSERAKERCVIICRSDGGEFNVSGYDNSERGLTNESN